MKALMVIVILIVIACFVMFYGWGSSGSVSAPGPRGVAERFLNSSLAGNIDETVTLAEESAKQNVRQTATQLKDLGMPKDWVPIWQRMKTQSAQDAYGVQMTGKGKMLVVDVNQTADGNWLIHNATLAEM